MRAVVVVVVNGCEHKRGRVKLSAMATAGPVAAFYAKGNEAWASCLMADVAAHGVPIIDATRSDRPAAVAQARAMLIVHSWFGGSNGGGLPTEKEIAHVKSNGGRVVVARRNWTKIHSEDYPGRDVVFALWDGYYQPAPHPAGRAPDSGWAGLLGQFGIRRAKNDVPSNYVFISYRRKVNGAFVREQLRGALALGGFASWDYCATENMDEPDPNEVSPSTKARLVSLVTNASALVVVATSGWWSPWTALELATARAMPGKPIVLVRPAESRPSRRALLNGVSVEVLRPGQLTAPRTTAALAAAGVSSVLPPNHGTQWPKRP